MDADFSIELGREDPVLDLPWTDQSGELAYFDLKRQPELIKRVEEATQFPELASFLVKMNAPSSLLESAKCDVWTTSELSAEEAIFNASHKFASYVDLVFSGLERRTSFPLHENFVRNLTELLRHAPEIGASLEVCVRRCFFEQAGVTPAEPSGEGFYFTVYVNGYGKDELAAREKWAVALELVSAAILQLSAAG